MVVSEKKEFTAETLRRRGKIFILIAPQARLKKQNSLPSAPQRLCGEEVF